MTSEPKKKKPVNRKIKLSNGDVIHTTDNRKKQVIENGKNIFNKEQPDPEEQYTPEKKQKYPPPKGNAVFQERWNSLVDHLIQRDNFNPSHLYSLEMLCDLYSEYEELSKFIRMNGQSHKVATVTGESMRMYPQVKQRDAVRHQIQKLCTLLDLFPKKGQTPKGNGDPGDEWK